MKGSLSARKTADGLDVVCRCGARHTVPADGSKRLCRCGTVHCYDGVVFTATREIEIEGEG